MLLQERLARASARGQRTHIAVAVLDVDLDGCSGSTRRTGAGSATTCWWRSPRACRRWCGGETPCRRPRRPLIGATSNGTCTRRSPGRRSRSP
ncbi:MAG: hypothetical protein H7269_06450 [Cellulomonas sp.]|nr:hypothetical protein [Cellulomonas sp.]